MASRMRQVSAGLVALTKLLAGPFLLGVLITLACTRLAFAQSCQGDERPVITVTPEIEPVKMDYSRSIAQLSSMRVDTKLVHREKNPRINGLTSSQVGEDIRIGYLEKEGCLLVEFVELKVILRQTVFIANDYPAGTCEHDAIVKHELKHVRVDETMLNKWLPRYELAMKRNVIGPLAASPVDSEAASLSRRVEAQNQILEIVRDVSEQMYSQRKRYQNAVDRPSEYRRVQASCSNWLR